jgi:hypothetical protein
MKKQLAVVAVLILVFSAITASNARAAEIANTGCINVGSEKTVSGTKYVCRKVGNLKRWKISSLVSQSSNSVFKSAGKALQSIYPDTKCLTRISTSTKGGNGAAVLGINDTIASCSSQESLLGNFIFVYSDKVDISKRLIATKTWPLTHITLKSQDYLFEFASDAGDTEWLTNLAAKIQAKFGTTDVIRVFNGPGPNCKTPADQITSECRIHHQGVFTSPTAIKPTGNCAVPGYQIRLNTYYADGGWVVGNTSTCSLVVAYTGLLQCTWEDKQKRVQTDQILIDKKNFYYADLSPGDNLLVKLTDGPEWDTDCQELSKPYVGKLSFGKELTAWVTSTK